MSTERIAQRAISYRAEPTELVTAEIVTELFWLMPVITWHCELGDHARVRAAALRAELRRRQGGVR